MMLEVLSKGKAVILTEILLTVKLILDEIRNQF